MVTDAAGWLRDRLGIKGSSLSAKTRYWILGMTLIGSAVTGMVLWELINPVSMLHRGLIFGIGRRGWSSGHLPVRPVRDEPRLVRAPVSGGAFTA